nr:MAG TPA: hypothetical protein [Caudoviricetes sp.]
MKIIRFSECNNQSFVLLPLFFLECLSENRYNVLHF